VETILGSLSTQQGPLLLCNLTKNRQYNFITHGKQQLPHQIHHRAVYRQRIRVGIAPLRPQEVRQEPGRVQRYHHGNEEKPNAQYEKHDRELEPPERVADGDEEDFDGERHEEEGEHY